MPTVKSGNGTRSHEVIDNSDNLDYTAVRARNGRLIVRREHDDTLFLYREKRTRDTRYGNRLSAIPRAASP